MYLFDQTILGIIVLLLLGVMVAVKRFTTGMFLEKPRGNLQAVIANTYNIFFLLIAIPAAAILLIIGQQNIIDPIHLSSDMSGFMTGLEIAGLVIFILGNILMIWALTKLGHYYQVGGTLPRMADRMIIDGPYGLIRHPMYTAALSISLGLACLIHSLIYFVIFIVYLVLIILLIPDEETGLRQVYGKQYITYIQHTKKLIPFLY